MTEEVEHEHELIRKALDAVSAACATWREQPSTDTGAGLAVALDELNSVAQRHLDDEEQKIVPLAAVTVTQQEWDAIGEHAVAQIPRAKKAIAFGMLLEPLNNDDRAHMKRVLPPPVRLLYPLVIGRPWKKYAFTLRSDS